MAAARLGDVGLQVIRDRVLRFNAKGPAGLIDGKAPGKRPKLNDAPRQALARIGEAGPDHGFGDRLLASVFAFEFQRQQVYWVYNYKTGKFYPFVPNGPRKRDNATELRLGEIMKEQKLPVERKLENWYALWGIPF